MPSLRTLGKVGYACNFQPRQTDDSKWREWAKEVLRDDAPPSQEAALRQLYFASNAASMMAFHEKCCKCTSSTATPCSIYARRCAPHVSRSCRWIRGARALR
eukprot:759199-Amphidinium_carterae.2